METEEPKRPKVRKGTRKGMTDMGKKTADIYNPKTFFPLTTSIKSIEEAKQSISYILYTRKTS